MTSRKVGRLIEHATVLVACASAAGLVAIGTASGLWPEWHHVLLLAGLVVLGDNLAIDLPGKVRAGVAMPMALAYLAAADHSPVLAAGLISAAGGIHLGQMRRRRFSALTFNTALFFLCGAAAGGVFLLLRTVGVPGVAAFPLAALADAALNILVLVPVLSLGGDAPADVVWRQLLRSLPTALALSMLGVLVGGLLGSHGPLVVVLLLVPVLVARAFFAASLRAEAAEVATVDAFLAALATRDEYTARHTRRVATYATWIGEELNMPPRRLERLRRAALLHDIGKLAVPLHLLNKPGRLTRQEYAEVQRHDEIVIDLMHRVGFLEPLIDLVAEPAARARRGIHGTPPPLEFHIVHVADAFDAMTSTRAYRRALSMEVAMSELLGRRGEQFVPECVDALVRAIRARGVVVGEGHEPEQLRFATPPPSVGVGSAGLGDLEA